MGQSWQIHCIQGDFFYYSASNDLRVVTSRSSILGAYELLRLSVHILNVVCALNNPIHFVLSWLQHISHPFEVLFRLTIESWVFNLEQRWLEIQLFLLLWMVLESGLGLESFEMRWDGSELIISVHKRSVGRDILWMEVRPGEFISPLLWYSRSVYVGAGILEYCWISCWDYVIVGCGCWGWKF